MLNIFYIQRLLLLFAIVLHSGETPKQSEGLWYPLEWRHLPHEHIDRVESLGCKYWSVKNVSVSACLHTRGYCTKRWSDESIRKVFGDYEDLAELSEEIISEPLDWMTGAPDLCERMRVSRKCSRVAETEEVTDEPSVIPRFVSHRYSALLGSGQPARKRSVRIAGKKKLKRPANDLHYYTSSSEDNGDDDGYRVSPRFDHISSDAEMRVDDIDQPSTLGSGQLARRMSKRIAGKKKLKRPANDLHYYTSSSEDNGDDDDGYCLSPSSKNPRRRKNIDSRRKKNPRSKPNEVFEMIEEAGREKKIHKEYVCEAWKLKMDLQNNRKLVTMRASGEDTTGYEKVTIPRNALLAILDRALQDTRNQKDVIQKIWDKEKGKLDRHSDCDANWQKRYKYTANKFPHIINAFKNSKAFRGNDPACDLLPSDIKKQYDRLTPIQQEDVNWVVKTRCIKRICWSKRVLAQAKD